MAGRTPTSLRDRCLIAAIVLAVLAAGPGLAGAGHGPFATVLTIDAESLKGLIDEGRAPLPIDLRPAADYRSGRLPAARSIPLDEMERRLGEIPRDRLVILYCACPVPAVTPVYQFLRSHGYTDVFVLEDGLGGWRARGYPLER